MSGMLRWTQEQLDAHLQKTRDALDRHVRMPAPAAKSSSWQLLDLRLPYPPSGNLTARHARNGAHYAPERVRSFRKSVAAICTPTGGDRALAGRLRAFLTLCPRKPKRATGKPPRVMDLDNAFKATLDALQHAGVFANDRQIAEIHAAYGEPVPGGAVLVRLEVMG